jgi:hypothetical protein
VGTYSRLDVSTCHVSECPLTCPAARHDSHDGCLQSQWLSRLSARALTTPDPGLLVAFAALDLMTHIRDSLALALTLALSLEMTALWLLLSR